MPTDAPPDLVPLADAAAAVHRSVATLRRWMRDGRVRRWEGVAPAHGGSPPALVSLAEVVEQAGVLAHVSGAHGGVTGVQATGVQGRVAAAQPPPEAVDVAEVEALRRDLETARADAAAARVEAADREVRALRQRMTDLEAARDDWRRRHDEVRAQLDVAQDEGARLRAELARARAERDAVPYWRRWLAGLPGPVAGED